MYSIFSDTAGGSVFFYSLNSGSGMWQLSSTYGPNIPNGKFGLSVSITASIATTVTPTNSESFVGYCALFVCLFSYNILSAQMYCWTLVGGQWTLAAQPNAGPSGGTSVAAWGNTYVNGYPNVTSLCELL